jgi:hypothetical protein
MDEFDDDPYDRRPSKGTIAAIVGLIAVGAFVALTFMGGQVSTVLSNVGNSLPGDSVLGPVGGSEDGADGPAGADVPLDDPDGKANPVVDPAAAPADLLIVRTGEMQIEVADVDAAVATTRSRIAAIGGYVSSSEESAGAADPTATVTFRVPADRWDEALATVRDVATATRHVNVDTQAVTSQVVDLGARITNLRASEVALQKIMDQATKIPDVLEVQAKLSDVRGEIERLVAQKESLEEQAAFGTLSVSFMLPAPPVVEEVRAGWDPAVDADAAAGTLIKIAQRGVSFGIWVAIVGIPVVASFALAIGLVVAFVLVARRLIGRTETAPSEP